MTPAETLAMAQSLLDRPDARTAGIWPRAAAFLARQALEQGLDAFWRAKGLPLHNLGVRPQLICLSRYVSESEVAGKTGHAWSALTRACHHHPYELPAARNELKSWLGAVAEVLDAVQGG